VDADYAGALAGDVADFLRAMPDSPVRNPDSARTPIFFAATEFVPDDAVAAVIPHGKEGHPVIAAVKDDKLYLVQLTYNESSPDEPKAATSLLHLDPAVGSALVVVAYRGDARFQTRSCEWSFDLGKNLCLTIASVVAYDERGTDPAERVAVAIAEALGWTMPSSHSASRQ
jgi:hypothetical protein